jgi:hypothetical protein
MTTADLRGDILGFYSDLSAPIETKKDADRWQSVLTSLDQLKLVTPASVAVDGPARNAATAPAPVVTKPVDTTSSSSTMP